MMSACGWCHGKGCAQCATDWTPDHEGTPERASTWRRLDLAATVDGLVAGTLERPTPTVAPIRGGSGLFYRGKVNGLAGESGAGKTWTVLHAAAGILADGAPVVFIDHEDDAAGIVGRLLDLDVSPEAIRDRFAYLNPSEKPTAGDLHALAALVADLQPSLVAIDSTGEGLALEGANPNADEDVAAWFLRVPRRLALVTYGDLPGPAVVTLDHVTKADDNAGLWPIGSQRKRAAISGAQYMQRIVRPFDKDTPGHALLVCAKDRLGNYAKGQRVAELHVTPGPTITLDAVTAAATGPFLPTGYMERVSRALEAASGPLTFNKLSEVVSGKRAYIQDAVSALIAAGNITTQPGPRGSILHTLAMKYREPVSDAPTGSTGSGSLGGEPGTSDLTGSGNQSGTSGNQCRLHGVNRARGCYSCDLLTTEGATQ